MTPLSSRILTALLLLAAFVPAALWAPAWLWAALMAAVIGLAAFEWARMSRFAPYATRIYAVVLAVAAFSLPHMLGAAWPSAQAGLLLLAAAFWLVVAPLWLLVRWRGEQRLVRAAVGAVVLLPTFVALVYLHGRGAGVLFGVVAIVWIADTAAYLSGRRFGRHKLAPAISPGKTWEGVAGALVAVLAYAAALSAAIALPLPALALTLAGLLYLSVLGDLYESWIKRVAGVKDSGSLLPGHGGVFDRIDALTSTLPVAAGMLMWLERGA
ncbi:MAG TPA: phosphatidate cytidylyltransferase [Thiobacillaceae bacterium]|nr:phosphatidate cytidylyltransferase [Thiobacillaceae bacterium]